MFALRHRLPACGRRTTGKRELQFVVLSAEVLGQCKTFALITREGQSRVAPLAAGLESAERLRTRFPLLFKLPAPDKEPSSMEFQDKVLTCIDCGTTFVFTAGEQLFFHDKQFKNEPKRCKACKAKRTSALSPPATMGNGHRTARVETRAICSQCGRETTVPFRPTQGRPILCRECFMQKRVSSA